MNRHKLIKSLLISVNTTLFSTLCITLAWYSAIRISDTKSNGLSSGAFNGELYFYSGNFDKKLEGETTKFIYNGFSESDLLDFSSNKPLFSDSYNINDDAYFYKYINGDTTFSNPFKMINSTPGSRYLFIVRFTNSYANPVNAYLRLYDWEASWLDDPNLRRLDENGNEIFLTEAIHFYCADQAFVKGDDASIKSNISNYVNTTLGKNYNLNKFASKNANNQNNGKLNAPLLINKFQNIAGKTDYYFPFVLEFTNDPNTYYSPTDDPDNLPPTERHYKKSVNGNSNVYSGAKFIFKKLELSDLENPEA